MTFEITPEQIKENRTRLLLFTFFSLLVFMGTVIFFSYPSLSKVTDLAVVLVIWGVLFLIIGLSGYAGASNAQNKKTIKIELKPKTFVLFTAKGQDEISYEDVQKMNVQSVGEEVVSFVLFIKKRNLVFVKGFDRMTEMVKGFEKNLLKTTIVKRVQGKASLGKKVGVGSLMIVFLLVVAVLSIGLIVFLNKIGLGFLALPLSFVGMGISKFASSRGNRSNRIVGILMILGGVVWAVVHFLLIAHGQGN